MYISSANALIDRRVNMYYGPTGRRQPRALKLCAKSPKYAANFVFTCNREREYGRVYQFADTIRYLRKCEHQSNIYARIQSVKLLTRGMVSDSIESLPFRNIRLSTGNQQQLVV